MSDEYGAMERPSSSIPSFQPVMTKSTSSLGSKVNIKVTYDMVHNLDCDGLAGNALADLVPEPETEEIETISALSAGTCSGISIYTSGSSIGIGEGQAEEAAPEEFPIAEAKTDTTEIGTVGDSAQPPDSEYLHTAEDYYYEEAKEEEYVGWHSPQMMVLYEDGDIDCALHFLIQSLHEPFRAHAVATILVQERMLEEFKKRVVEKLRPLSKTVTHHPNYLDTLALLSELHVETIMFENFGEEKVSGSSVEESAESLPGTPILVRDCTQSTLGTMPTGVVTMHTFRSTMEAYHIYRKENMVYAAVSLWSESLLDAYGLVAWLDCNTFFLNCCNVDLKPIKVYADFGEPNVIVINGYHYEALVFNDMLKMIVFPVRTIIDAPVEDIIEEPAPIFFLDE